MPFTIVRNDITRMAVDAIVNSAAPHLLGGGGADGKIHRVAGPELAQACRKLGGCKPGQVKLTEGYGLPCRYVIHTVGPVWMGGFFGEEETLRACYRHALELAQEKGLETVAFPLISSGIFAYPRDKALRIAMDEIRDFVLDNDLMVYLVVYDAESFRISSRLQQDIQQFVDDRYVAEHSGEQLAYAPEPPQTESVSHSAPVPEIPDGIREAKRPLLMQNAVPFAKEISVWQEEEAPTADDFMEADWEIPDGCGAFASDTYGDSAPNYVSCREVDHEAILRDLLSQQDESFTQRLLRLIDEHGMTDPECYRRANVDRRLFSKIRNHPHYQPSKQTALAFAIALRLNRAETDQLLRTAGLALSPSSRFDLVVEYFIQKGIYDVMQINEALYAFDLPLLGN
ncbi:MAG: macro domain-containing protein [Clostridiales bacterium]|nr:macro domain-containing protein [Clostridiales bacterium]